MPIINFGSDAAFASGSNYKNGTSGAGAAYPGQPTSRANSGSNNGSLSDFQAGRGSNHLTNLTIDTNDADPYVVKGGDILSATFTYGGRVYENIPVVVNNVNSANNLNPETQRFVGTLEGNLVIDGQSVPFAINVFPNAQNYTGAIAHAGSPTGRATYVCFAAGTMIRTPGGDVPVETLRIGDLVMTSKSGPQELVWVGSRRVSPAELQVFPNMRPIVIRAGALGEGTPSRDLLVSPQHRVLVRSAIARQLFGADEVLVAAKKLLTVEGIDIADAPEVTYVHVMCDKHEVLFSNDAQTESMYLGREALKVVDQASRTEIIALFPELSDPEYVAVSAARILTGSEANNMVCRHKNEGMALV